MFRRENPLGNLSLPARVVIVLCIIGAVGATAGYISWAHDSLPSGSYPLWFFALPIVVVAGLVCGAGLAVLWAGGVPIYRNDDRPSPQEGAERQGLSDGTFQEKHG
jgi:hypothetical protein